MPISGATALWELPLRAGSVRATHTGAQIGHYEILSAIGRGAMGEVWKARDTSLQRDVAIKTLPSELEQHPEHLARFEREALSLAAVSHPNIASVYGFEEQEGRRYIVLELVAGETLAERLHKRRAAVWGPPGSNELYYADFAGALRAVPVQLTPELRVDAPMKLLDDFVPPGRGGGQGRLYDVSPRDGRFIVTRLVAPPEASSNDISVVLSWFEELRELVPSR